MLRKKRKGNCPAGCDCVVQLVTNPNIGIDTFYCEKCGMYFWYNHEHERFLEIEENYWQSFINDHLSYYIARQIKPSILIKVSMFFNGIKNSICDYLLEEKCYFRAKNYPYTLHIDSKEANHSTPHVHFYYGCGKNMPRSIGYRIDNLSPLGKETNQHLKKNPKKFYSFLNLVKQWHKNISEDGKTGQEILQIAWNYLKIKKA